MIVWCTSLAVIFYLNQEEYCGHFDMTYMCCFFSGKIHGFLFIAILVSFLLINCGLIAMISELYWNHDHDFIFRLFCCSIF